MTTIAVRTGNLDVPGATIHYELRGRGPLLVLHAAPMTADAFAGAADLFAADHTVLTSDPRGLGASTVDDRDRDVSPELRADDMIRLLEHVDAGPAVLFGSSGGAVSALALQRPGPTWCRPSLPTSHLSLSCCRIATESSPPPIG